MNLLILIVTLCMYVDDVGAGDGDDDVIYGTVLTFKSSSFF